jgi:hypothetical protein
MIPHERSLVKRLEGKPFALIGVNTDSDRKMVRSRSVEDQVTWRSFYDTRVGGPICQSYAVSSYPTIYIIDHKGVIRFKNLRGEQMDKAVEKLLAEMEAVTQ